jgi:hypothetical protein
MDPRHAFGKVAELDVWNSRKRELVAIDLDCSIVKLQIQPDILPSSCLKGFGLEGDEPGGVQMNRSLRLEDTGEE